MHLISGQTSKDLTSTCLCTPCLPNAARTLSVIIACAGCNGPLLEPMPLDVRTTACPTPRLSQRPVGVAVRIQALVLLFGQFLRRGSHDVDIKCTFHK